MRSRHTTVARSLATVGVGCATLALTTALASPASAAGDIRGLWHFDETSGSVAADSSGNGNEGRIINTTLGAPGHLGTAFDFDGRTSRVEVANDSSLNPGTSDFEVTAWVNFTDAPGSGETYDVFRKGLSGTSGGEFKLEIYTGGRAKCTAKDSTKRLGVVAGPTTNLANGQWHKVGCKLIGSTWSVIVDSTVKSTSVPFGSISNSKSVSIGSKYGQEDWFHGRIDEVQLSIG